MATPTGTSDKKSPITAEELADRCELARQAFARNGKVKLSWTTAAHALKHWPPRDPLELRRLAMNRRGFKIQVGKALKVTAGVPATAPKAKPVTRGLRGVAPAPVLDKRQPPPPAGWEPSAPLVPEMVQVNGQSVMVISSLLDLPASLGRTLGAAGILDTQVKAIRLGPRGAMRLELAGGRHLEVTGRPTGDQGGEG